MVTLTKHLEKQGKIDFILTLVKAELDKLEKDSEDKYYNSQTSDDNESYILNKTFELLEYDYEKDNKRNTYCLGATPIEIWQYWLREILPNL